MSGMALSPAATAEPAAAPGWRRWLEPIWHITGAVPLNPGQSAEQALDRLDPLFHEYGTTYERSATGITFRKQDQPAQDKMAVFDHGELSIERGLLHYRLASRALLFCFFAPLLFLTFAGLTIGAGYMQQTPVEDVKKTEKKAEAPSQHPFDKMMGAPAPEALKKKDPAKAAEDKKPSPTSAYVFAAIFAVLYLLGRWLEARLVRRLFTRRLLDS